MPATGFFTDTTLCIGCKACEVACKQWNQLPDDGFFFTAMSYDNTVHLGASTWRHVAFIERPVPLQNQDAGLVRRIECADAPTAHLIVSDRRLRKLCQLTSERYVVFGIDDEAAVRRGLRELGYVLPGSRS